MKKRFLISIAALAAFASSAGAQGLGIYGGFNFSIRQSLLMTTGRADSVTEPISMEVWTMN